MTAIINMASVSTWNSKLPGNRSHSEDKDSGGIAVSSWRRENEKQKHSSVSSDSVSMNGGLYVDSENNSNVQDVNKSSNTTVNHQGVNGNSEMGQVDKHNLVSITENPFFKSYGKIRTLHTKNECRTERDRIHSDSSALSPKVMFTKESENIFVNNYPVDEDKEGEEEEEVEYHPGSGFVSKLLGKFKLKYEREERSYTPVPMKRSASLENILDERQITVTRNSKGVRNETVASVIGQPNLNHRTNSEDYINHTIKPLPGKPTPDAKLGRRDIVIIESPSESTSNETQQNGAISTRAGSLSPTITTTSLREEINEVDELPKPNTVINTRFIFESTKAAKGKAPPPRPSHPPSHPPGTKISAVAPTKNVSTSVSSSTTNLNRNKAVNDGRKLNNAQKPREVTTKIVQESRSTLPPITNRNKKPSPVVTVAPYKPKSEENYTSTTTTTKNTISVPVPQKPVITPRQIDKIPLQPKITSSFTSQIDSKEDKIVENNDIDVIKKENEAIKSVKEIISPVPDSDNIKTTSTSDTINRDLIIDSNLDNSGSIIKGIPTIIAQRMRRENADSMSASNEQYSSQNSELNSSGNNNVQNTGDIPSAAKKRQAPAVPTSSVVANNDQPKEDLPESQQELSPKQNLHSSRNKDIGGPAMVFDSSMVAKKKRKPNYSNNNSGVPRLDLTSINNDTNTYHGYQEGYKPTEIKPCKIIFIGALVDTGHSLLKKGKSNKGRIKFNDQAITLHEYPSELHMLEEYLLKHPEEEEIIILESFNNDINETSDDVEDIPSTPRQQHSDDEVLKSNTSLSHSGGLSSYVSKYQEEFDWNNHREPEPIVIRPESDVDSTNPDEVGIIPASEDDTNTWSASTTSDLLF